jgi:soluble lytic murein transglycosylase-like protein
VEAPDCPALPQSEIAELARESAEKEGLTPDLLHAIIGKESSFRPCAVSPKGAVGLMQLMPATSQQLGVTDPFDPKQNVAAGSKLLRSLLNRYGEDLSLALGAYNAGPGQVDRYQGLPPFVETMDYVRDILRKLPSPDPGN